MWGRRAGKNHSGYFRFEMKENYSSYLERYREAPRPEIEIIVPAEKFSKTNMDIEILSDYQGFSGKAIKTAEKDT